MVVEEIVFLVVEVVEGYWYWQWYVDFYYVYFDLVYEFVCYVVVMGIDCYVVVVFMCIDQFDCVGDVWVVQYVQYWFEDFFFVYCYFWCYVIEQGIVDEEVFFEIRYLIVMVIYYQGCVFFYIMVDEVFDVFFGSCGYYWIYFGIGCYVFVDFQFVCMFGQCGYQFIIGVVYGYCY